MNDEQSLAFQYWTCLRLAAREDRVGACVKYGVDVATVELAASLTTAQIQDLAIGVDLLIFKPVLTAAQLSKLVAVQPSSQYPYAKRIYARLAMPAE